MPDRPDVAVWAVRLDLDPDALARVAGILAPDERARAGRLRRPADRDRFIAGRAQLRQVLGRYLDADPASIRFGCSAAGKPSLAEATDDARGLKFNVSGSGRLGLIAIRAGCEIGVDLEFVRDVPEIDRRSAQLLSASERSDYDHLPSADRPRRFFDYWARKEALAKCDGSGLGTGLDRYSLHPWPGDRACRIETSHDGEAASLWVMPLALPVAGYAAAIASERQMAEVTTRWWNPAAAPRPAYSSSGSIARASSPTKRSSRMLR